MCSSTMITLAIDTRGQLDPYSFVNLLGLSGDFLFTLIAAIPNVTCFNEYMALSC